MVRVSEVFTAVKEVDEGGAEEEGADDGAGENGVVGAEERVDEGKEIKAPDARVETEVIKGGPSIEGLEEQETRDACDERMGAAAAEGFDSEDADVTPSGR